MSDDVELDLVRGVGDDDGVSFEEGSKRDVFKKLNKILLPRFIE